MNRAEILEAAHTCVCGEREHDYLGACYVIFAHSAHLLNYCLHVYAQSAGDSTHGAGARFLCTSPDFRQAHIRYSRLLLQLFTSHTSAGHCHIQLLYVECQ